MFCPKPFNTDTNLDDFEEIIEDADENKSNPDDIDDIVDEVGDVEMPMGETGHKFHEIVLSEDDCDSVVIEDRKKEIDRKATMFQSKFANKYSNSYDYNCKVYF